LNSFIQIGVSAASEASRDWKVPCSIWWKLGKLFEFGICNFASGARGEPSTAWYLSVWSRVYELALQCK
jgi:hypothetical protein